VGVFFFLKRYERKQPWFVRNCVNIWFGQRVKSHSVEYRGNLDTLERTSSKEVRCKAAKKGMIT
jgi:hypothetical protein